MLTIGVRSMPFCFMFWMKGAMFFMSSGSMKGGGGQGKEPWHPCGGGGGMFPHGGGGGGMFPHGGSGGGGGML